MDQPTPPSTAVPTPGRAESLLGEKYRVSRLLGEGGMGAVYEAENTWTRRRVAIKVMRPEYARDAEAMRRFLREAQSAAQVDHPNVVSVLDLGHDALTGSLFIVQEFLLGRELRALLDERGSLPAEEALAIVMPVIDGLVAAHSLGVVHRDLKPENIFLVESRGGRVLPKLIDFGIAKALRPGENEFRTLVQQTIGTPAYMSPEQARGDVDVDARSDVWSMGVVLYELVTGRLPFDDDSNPQIVLARVITQTPLPIDRAAPAVAADLRAVVDRAIRPDRDERFPDMASFYAALSATQVGGNVRDTLRRIAADAPTSSALAAEAPAQPPTRRRSRAVAVAVVAVLALLAFAAWLPPRRPARSLSAQVVYVPPAPAPAPASAVVAAPVPAPAVVAAPVPAPAVVAAPAPAPAERRPTRPSPRRGAAPRGANGAAIID